ncbi:MAG: type II toxin-antitoxin system RelB/DinJ family antitoxin, partial [Clostridia bacterium]|nr:type II toxin-antitoxin system RelB/DinJ family antitoxin [Clostridia bacterium]
REREEVQVLLWGGGVIIANAVNLRYNSGGGDMSMNSTYNIRIDKDIKQEADTLYKNMGMSLSAAINLFLTQSVIQRKLPLTEVVAEPSYGEALLRDFAEAKAAIENGTAIIYDTPEDMFAAWDKEDVCGNKARS